MARHLSHEESIYSIGAVADTNALKAIDVTSLPDNTWAYVETEGEYYFINVANEVEALPQIVQPALGNGRWFKKKVTGANSLSFVKQLASAGQGGGSVSDDPFSASWDGDTSTAASRNALYDKIISLYENGGNAFGANAAFGTNDTFSLVLKTNNLVRLTVDAAGNVSIADTTSASSPGTGALVVAGGIGVGDDSWFGSNLTVQGIVKVHSPGGNAFMYINSSPGFQSKLQFSKSDNPRWTLEANDIAESGSDTGSDLTLSAFNDAGSFIDSPIMVGRSGGGRILFNRNVAIGGNIPTHRLHVINAVSNIPDPGDAYVANIENNASGDGYKNILKCVIGNSGNTYAESEFAGFYFGANKIGKIKIGFGGTSVGYDTTSDERLKENITDTSKGLADLLSIKVRDYNFKEEIAKNGKDKKSKNTNNGKQKNKQTGFIAQEIAELFPDIVSVGGDDPLTDPWMMDYSKMTPVIVKAIQDMYNQLKDKGLLD